MTIIILGLVWDEENEEHIFRHRVLPQEVEEALEEPLHNRKHRGRQVVFGQTYGGRYLTIILEDLGQGEWRVITARNCSVKERSGLSKRQQGANRRR